MASKEEMSRIGKSNVRRGKSNERVVAKLLREYTGVEFRRRRVEGRDSTVIERESTADVIPVSGNILFSIEVKCGSCPSFDGLLSNPAQNQMTKWWHQATYDAQLLTQTILNGRDKEDRYNKDKSELIGFFPLLFFKPGHGFNWIAIDQQVFANKYLKSKSDGVCYTSPWMPHFAFNHYSKLGRITHDVSHSGKHKNWVSLTLPDLYFIRWKDFAAQVDPSSIFI